ncbi:alpha/beta hydrolase family protein [Ceratobasidium sp. AG-Ba]|nr:alpha/beta hydrolase family protein [Ceratobasidium sp. AG-Ba]
MTSEKGLPTTAHPPSSPSKRPARRTLVWAAAALLAYHAYNRSPFAANKAFAESTVARGITWWACPDVTTTECAYLTVPRDYSDPHANDTVSLFLRKVPATVGPNDYLGSILINPGGPGGSGSAMAAGYGFQLRDMVDGRYDIIGFDPRGVNMTIPELNCFGSEAQGRHAMYRQTQLGIPYDARGPKYLPAGARAAGEQAFTKKMVAMDEATNAACETHGNTKMLQSVSTTLVVQDIERIVEALAQDGLNFWGFSYGTILGSTFAAMRPHLVKRMVLDGVSDAESYHNDIYQWGRDGLVDTHKTLSGFFDYCAEAGPERCAFARHPNKTASSSSGELQSRLGALYERLRERPMLVPHSSIGSGILTASDAKQVIFRGLYAPKSWPMLAQVLADAENGKPQGMYERVYGEFATLHAEPGNKNVFNRYMETAGLTTSTAAIMCGDSEPANWKSFDDLVEYFHELASIGPIGENWALWMGFCRQWKIRPIERYDGPWSTQAGLKKTRFPILYASLDADPVTPLSAAIKMSKAFGNESAVLLTQEGVDHAPRLAHPSLCTAKILKDYFVKGKVPAPGTHCKPEPGYLFPGNDTKSITTLSAEDRKLLHALEGLDDLGRSFHQPI